MADDAETSGPDGIVVMHFPSDGSDSYGVGPFPPDPDLVDAVIENGPCDCRKVLLPVIFPKGIMMMVDGSNTPIGRAFTVPFDKALDKVMGEAHEDEGKPLVH
jgi:hypothetical protein